MNLIIPVFLLLLLFLVYIAQIFYRIYKRFRKTEQANRPLSNCDVPSPLPNSPRTLLTVLGSGGHTAEMLTLISDLFESNLFPTPPPLLYIVSATDTHSASRAIRLHKETSNSALHNATYTILTLPRAREVGESIPSSIRSTLKCFRYAWSTVCKSQADVILTNGPATGAVVAWAGILHEAIYKSGKTIIYIESFARVETLSFSGRLLYHFADRFLVQWPELAEKYRKSEYLGRLS